MEQLLSQTKDKMSKALLHLEDELRGVRTGRATPALLENVKVTAYGSTMDLRDLASINAPEPRLLLVQPFDANNIEAVDKAIRDSGLGFNPATDSNAIRVPIPALTEERRAELAKLVSEKAEESRVALRSIRREAMDETDRAKKASKISEDEHRRQADQIQKTTDENMKTLEDRIKAKLAEIAQV